MTAAISSARLDLVPLTPELLRLIEADDLAGFGRHFGVEVPGDWAEAVPSRRRLSQLATDPAAQPWLVRAIVSREPRLLVGSIGFHEMPDDLGCVEIGYQVVAEQRRRGYAREAVLALADWAHESGKVDIVMAAISPGNEPSIRLVESLGFVCTDREYDEYGAPELIFETELPLKP